MVEVDMRISGSMDKLAGPESADLCHHHAEESIGGNVEGQTQETVGGTLVELQGEASVGNIELKESMTRRKIHISEIRHIPCADNNPARIRIMLYGLHHFGYLVDECAVVGRP